MKGILDFRDIWVEMVSAPAVVLSPDFFAE